MGAARIKIAAGARNTPSLEFGQGLSGPDAGGAHIIGWQ
jgi:hypothetical protein